MIEVFVNELSLHEQYHPAEREFTEAIRDFYSVFARLHKIEREQRLYWNDDPFRVYGAIKGELFISSLNRIRDKSRRTALIDVLWNKLNVRDWKPERLHSSTDRFECDGEYVTDTSVAELAERKIQNAELMDLLVNFPRSKYAGFATIDVVKNRGGKASLSCAENTSTLEGWIETRFPGPPRYSCTDTTPPTDAQTILRNRQRFRRTSRIEQGRSVYKELETGYHWYVDNKHSGSAAHLEVFDAQGGHVGESDLAGNVDPAQRKRSRRLRIK